MPKTPHSSLNLSSMSWRLHATPFRRNTRLDALDAQTRSASSTDRSIDDRRRSTAIRSRFPPVWPMTRAGTPAAAALLQHGRQLHPATTDTMTRDADSPNSAAATFTRASRATLDAVDRDLGAAYRPCRSSIRPARRRARRPSSRAPTGSAARSRACTSSDCSARSAARSSRRRHAAHQIVRSTFRYSLPPSSPRSVAEQHDGVAGLLEPSRRRRGRHARAGRRRR